MTHQRTNDYPRPQVLGMCSSPFGGLLGSRPLPGRNAKPYPGYLMNPSSLDRVGALVWKSVDKSFNKDLGIPGK